MTHRADQPAMAAMPPVTLTRYRERGRLNYVRGGKELHMPEAGAQTKFRISPDVNRVSIVFIGKFTPSAFHPLWLAENGLLGKEEAHSALRSDGSGLEVSWIFLPQATQFRVDWATFAITEDRFAIDALEEPFVKIFDFVTKCFGELQATPIRQLGINRIVRFNAASLEKWHGVGDTLAPKAPWTELLGPVTKEERLGGLLQLTMTRHKRPDTHKGYINCRVTPRGPLVIEVDVNDHYETGPDEGEGPGSKRALDILSENFNVSVARTVTIINEIMALAC